MYSEYKQDRKSEVVTIQAYSTVNLLLKTCTIQVEETEHMDPEHNRLCILRIDSFFLWHGLLLFDSYFSGYRSVKALQSKLLIWYIY